MRTQFLGIPVVLGVVLAILLASASARAEVLSIDFVRILNGKLDEAVYYYENNWKAYRVEAARLGFISSYQMLIRTSEEGETDILLITGYADDEQYANREENFATIMDSAAEDGTRLMNSTPPAEFREFIDAGNFVVH